jgi:hypothetical protein
MYLKVALIPLGSQSVPKILVKNCNYSGCHYLPNYGFNKTNCKIKLGAGTLSRKGQEFEP